MRGKNDFTAVQVPSYLTGLYDYGTDGMMDDWLEVQLVVDVAFVNRTGGSRREAWRRLSRALQWARARLREQLCVDIAVNAVVFLSDKYPFRGYRVDLLTKICDYFREREEMGELLENTAGNHDLVGIVSLIFLVLKTKSIYFAGWHGPRKKRQIVLVSGLEPPAAIGTSIFGSICWPNSCALVYDLFRNAIQMPHTLLHGIIRICIPSKRGANAYLYERRGP